MEHDPLASAIKEGNVVLVMDHVQGGVQPTFSHVRMAAQLVKQGTHHLADSVLHFLARTFAAADPAHVGQLTALTKELDLGHTFHVRGSVGAKGILQAVITQLRRAHSGAGAAPQFSPVG